MEIHDGTFPPIAVSQKIVPKLKGDPVHWLSSDFLLAPCRLYRITSCSHFTHITLQLHATMPLHNSHITNFHIIQAVYVFFILYSKLFLWVDTFRKGLSSPKK